MLGHSLDSLKADTPSRGKTRARARFAMQTQGNKMQRRAGGRENTMKDLFVGALVSIRLEKVDRRKTDF
jgi:hypothetical protein